MMPIWSGIEGVYEAAFRNAALICKNKLSPLVMSDKIPLTVVATSDGSGLIDRGRSYRKLLEMDVSNIDGDFAVEVHLSDPMPADEAQNMRMALEMSGGDVPLLSHETALTKFKIVSDPISEAQRILVEKMFRQYAPIEGLKLAIERGVVPGRITLPAGFSMGPDGQLVPDALMPQSEPVPQQPPMPQPQQMPDPAMMQAMAGMPQQPSLDELAGMPPGGPMMAG
jgi:hypothetical protein